jgi:hypothetical protein
MEGEKLGSLAHYVAMARIRLEIVVNFYTRCIAACFTFELKNLVARACADSGHCKSENWNEKKDSLHSDM